MTASTTPATAPDTWALRGLALLDAVLRQIDAEPKLWDQENWASETDCGTAFCVAGWAARLAMPNATLVDSDGIPHRAGQYMALPTTIRLGHLIYGVGQPVPLDEIAQHVLQLDSVDSAVLFDEFNDRDDIQRIRDALAAAHWNDEELIAP